MLDEFLGGVRPGEGGKGQFCAAWRRGGRIFGLLSARSNTFPAK